MTRKDFEAIAAVLKGQEWPKGDSYANGMHTEWENVVNAFGDMLNHHNPRFDRARFLKACGLEG
jgi:hypothetical protein